MKCEVQGHWGSAPSGLKFLLLLSTCVVSIVGIYLIASHLYVGIICKDGGN